MCTSPLPTTRYEDVRHEMRVMREKYPSSRILFIAGDGLSLMRMNHLLASEYDEFLDQSPAVVPIQGGMRPLSSTSLHPLSPTCPARGDPG